MSGAATAVSLVAWPQTAVPPVLWTTTSDENGARVGYAEAVDPIRRGRRAAYDWCREPDRSMPLGNP
jgi:hypothetical protein